MYRAALPAGATRPDSDNPAGTGGLNGNAEAGCRTNDRGVATTMPGRTVTADSSNVICYTAGSFSYPSGTAFFAR